MFDQGLCLVTGLILGGVLGWVGATLRAEYKVQTHQKQLDRVEDFVKHCTRYVESQQASSKPLEVGYLKWFRERSAEWTELDYAMTRSERERFHKVLDALLSCFLPKT